MTKRTKRHKMTNNDLQYTIQKTIDGAARTMLKTGCELMCSGGLAVLAPVGFIYT